MNIVARLPVWSVCHVANEAVTPFAHGEIYFAFPISVLERLIDQRCPPVSAELNSPGILAVMLMPLLCHGLSSPLLQSHVLRSQPRYSRMSLCLDIESLKR